MVPLGSSVVSVEPLSHIVQKGFRNLNLPWKYEATWHLPPTCCSTVSPRQGFSGCNSPQVSARVQQWLWGLKQAKLVQVTLGFSPHQWSTPDSNHQFSSPGCCSEVQPRAQPLLGHLYVIIKSPFKHLLRTQMYQALHSEDKDKKEICFVLKKPRAWWEKLTLKGIVTINHDKGIGVGSESQWRGNLTYRREGEARTPPRCPIWLVLLEKATRLTRLRTDNSSPC